ncbi:MAG: hypothetical protein ACYC4R_02535 [Anaerolineae bacterium]
MSDASKAPNSVSMIRAPSLRALFVVCLILCLAGCARQTPCEALSGRIEKPPLSESAAAHLESRVAAILAAEGPQELTITDQEAISYLAPRLAGSRLRLQALHFQPGVVTIEASLDTKRPTLLRAALSVSAVDGAPHLTLHCSTLRGQVLPRWVLASAEAAGNAALADARLPWQVERIAIGEGALQISGSAR